jgi:hypothetical protein
VSTVHGTDGHAWLPHLPHRRPAAAGDGETPDGGSPHVPAPGPSAVEAGRREYADLGAVVHVGYVPEHAADDLALLYESSFSLLDYFPVYRPDLGAMNCCELDSPRHVLVFARRGDRLELLNRLFPIDAESLVRAIRAMWRALPDVRGIEMVTPLEPAGIGLPALVLRRESDMVVDLGGARHSALDLLSGPTRKHTRNYRNRLARELGSPSFRVYEGSDLTASLLHTVLELTRQRMVAKGRPPSPDDDYERALLPFARRWGFVIALMDGDTMAAADFCSRVGRNVFDHLGSFDPRYEHLEPGWLTTLAAADAAVAAGATSLHLLWGEHEYKFRLGGRPVPLNRVVLYPDRRHLVTAADDWLPVVARHTREQYHGARAAVGRAIDRQGRPGPKSGAAAPDGRRSRESGGRL